MYVCKHTHTHTHIYIYNIYIYIYIIYINPTYPPESPTPDLTLDPTDLTMPTLTPYP